MCSTSGKRSQCRFVFERTIFNDFFIQNEKWHHFGSVIPQPILNGGKFTSNNERQLHHIHLNNNNNNNNSYIKNCPFIKPQEIGGKRHPIFDNKNIYLYLNVKLRNSRKSLSTAWFASSGVQPTYFTCPHPKWKFSFSAFLKTVWKWFKYFFFFRQMAINKLAFVTIWGWKTEESLYCYFFVVSKCFFNVKWTSTKVYVCLKL